MKKYFSLLAIMLFSFLGNLCADENNYQLLSITPENNSTVEKFNEGDKITFSTNFDDDCGGFKVSIIDKYRQDNNMEGSLVYKTFVASRKNATSPWTVTFYQPLSFMKGHTYIVQMEGHEAADENSPVVATVQALYKGDGTEFTYSDATLTNIAPEASSTFNDADKNYVFLTFSKEVNIDKERSCIICSDGSQAKIEYFGNPYSEKGKTIWQLNVPKTVLLQSTGEFKLQIYAKDLDGQVVKGNKGLDENSYNEIIYKCDLGYPSVSVFPNEGKVTKLSTFNFSYDQDIRVINPEAILNLYNSDKSNVIYSFTANDLHKSADDENVLTYTLPDVLTTQGSYVLSIPEGVFGLGNGTSMLNNRAMEISYSITDRMEEYDVTITPADNSQVSSLYKFVITLNKWDAAIPFYRNKEKITLTDSEGNIITEGEASIDENRTKANQCIITLNKEISTSGSYRLNIPANAFIVDHTGNYYSDAMYFEYTVNELPAPTIKANIVPVKSENNELEKLQINFVDYSFVKVVDKNARIIIKDAAGNTVSSGRLSDGETWSRLNVIIVGDPITTDGTYFVHFPAQSICLGNQTYDKELVLEFVYDTTTAIANIEQPSDRTPKIYNLNGYLVGEGNPSEVLANKKGIFIVNGKKVVLK